MTLPQLQEMTSSPDDDHGDDVEMLQEKMMSRYSRSSRQNAIMTVTYDHIKGEVYKLKISYLQVILPPLVIS